MISPIVVSSSRPRLVPANEPVPGKPQSDIDRYSDATRRREASPHDTLLGALAAPRPTTAPNDAAKAFAWLDGLIRDNAAALGRARSEDEVAALVGRDDARGCVRLAARYDQPVIQRRIREVAVHAGVPPSRIENVVAGITDGMAAVVIKTTLRAPMVRALVGALATRNVGLSVLVDDPGQARALQTRIRREGPAVLDEVGLPRNTDVNAITTAARAAMRHNDVLAHRLLHVLSGGVDEPLGAYTIDAELTREVIAPELVGLSRREFPFTAVKADTLAKRAIRAEVQSTYLLDADSIERLASAVRATREAPPDYLQLLGR